MAQDDVGTTPEPDPTPDPTPEPAAEAPPTTPPDTPAPDAAAPAPAGDDPSQDNPVMALLSYLLGLIFVLIILLTDMKKSRFNRFHAWQALFYWLAVTVAFIVVWIIVGILSFIPFVGCFAFILPMALGVAVLVLSIMTGIKAMNKQEAVLPLVGEWATKQADK